MIRELFQKAKALVILVLHNKAKQRVFKCGILTMHRLNYVFVLQGQQRIIQQSWQDNGKAKEKEEEGQGEWWMVFHRFEITVCYVNSICFGSDEADEVDSNSEHKKKNKEKERENKNKRENEKQMENKNEKETVWVL